MRALQWLWDNREWLFSGIGVSALVALLAAGRRRRARATPPDTLTRYPHSGLEVRPIHYRIDVTRVVPQVEIELLAINYLSRPISLREVKVTRFTAGTLPAIDNVPLAHEVVLKPHSSFLVSCERVLADSEVRAAVTAPGSSWGGSLNIVARGMVRGKEVSYGPVTAQRIEGVVLVQHDSGRTNS